MAGHYHVWGRIQICTGSRYENLKERDHLLDLGVNGRISAWTLKRYGLTGFISVYGQVAGCFVQGNEHSDCIQCGGLLDWLSNC